MARIEYSLGGRECILYYVDNISGSQEIYDGENLQSSSNNVKYLLVQPVDEHDLSFLENEMAEIRRLSEQDFCLVTAKVESWNRDLSPWPAPAASR